MLIRLGIAVLWIALILDVQLNGMTGTPSRYALYVALLLLQMGVFLPYLRHSKAQDFSQEGTEK